MEANSITHKLKSASDDDLDPWNLRAGRSFVRLFLLVSAGLLANSLNLGQTCFLGGALP